MLRIAAVFCVLTPLAAQQPWIAQNGVVNSASRIPTSLAGGDIARGAQFTIFGVRFGTTGHTRVAVVSNGETRDAPIIATTPEQIEARMPETVQPGAASLMVTVDGRASASFPIMIAASNPGLFSLNGLGWGPARREIVKPGARLSLRGTGFGGVRHITAVIGGRAVNAAVSNENIEFTIPTDVPEGCNVPAYVLATPLRASNVVSISIAKSGACDSGPVPNFDAKTLGMVVLARSVTQLPSGDFIEDQATAVFASPGDQPVSSPLLLLPPAGTCTAYTSSLQSDTPLPNSISAALVSLLGGRGIDAGPKLELRGGSARRDIVRVNQVTGYYQGKLFEAGPHANRRAFKLFLDPGDFSFSAAGGSGIAAFETMFSVRDSFEWTDSSLIIERSKGLTIHWRDAPRDHFIVMLANNVDQLSTAVGTTVCVAPASSGQFKSLPHCSPTFRCRKIYRAFATTGCFYRRFPRTRPPRFARRGCRMDR